MRLSAVLLVSLLALACGGEDDASPTPTASADAGPPGETPYMAPCTSNDECETGLCFDFNAKGPHCTTTCELDLECAEPSPGCNGKGVCKAPDDASSGSGGGSGGGGG